VVEERNGHLLNFSYHRQKHVVKAILYVDAEFNTTTTLLPNF